MSTRKLILITLLLLALTLKSIQVCVHDDFSANATYHYYNDLTSSKLSRLLQTDSGNVTSGSNFGKMRIYADYTALKTGGTNERNIIKRIMNISANYFYNIIKVQRLPLFKYPSSAPSTCNILTVPTTYITKGVIGDLVVLVTNQVNPVQYIAKSIACLLQKSNNRPLMGIMIWNNQYLEYDQVGFQKLVYVGIHEIIHILGYSASMYNKYPQGNPYRNESNTQYLTSDLIVEELKNHFGCDRPLGIILQDQDGTLIPSHNERKLFGSEVMIASGKKNTYFSRLTLALLNSTGWYDVSFEYAEPTTWGKGKGCSFFNIDNCTSSEFCSGSDFGCDWDNTAMGKCDLDAYTGSCKLINYFTNTICIDQNYQLKNLNGQLEAQERGGHDSRCHFSNFRKTGLTPTILNNRCYVSICSFSGNFLFILVGGNILVCKPGIQLFAPEGLEGTLRCPSSFSNYCENKKTCPYNCNSNGVCINGKCLCTASTELTQTCLQTSLAVTQMQSTGGQLKSLKVIQDLLGQMKLVNSTVGTNSINLNQQLNDRITKGLLTGALKLEKQKKINNALGVGTFKDEFGYVYSCKLVFGCEYCNSQGCFQCDNGRAKVNGKCLQAKRLL